MTLTTIKKAGLDELALDHVFTIGASGSSAYTFQGEGLNGTVNNPTLYLTRGKTYRFENGSGGHPIRIQSTSGASGTAYNTGVTNNAGSGTVIVEVQHDAPDVLYYQCTSHAAMNGILYITGALADGGVTTAKIAADAVTGAKIADDAINSEHYTDGSIDTAHIADLQVTPAKLSIMDNVNAAGTAGKLRLNPDDNSTTWQRENKNLHQIRDDVYVEGTVNVGDKAGFDFTPLAISAFSYSGTTLTLTTASHTIAVGDNILIKDSASGFQEAFNTISGTTGTTVKVTRSSDPSSSLSTANTKVIVYTPADPRGCINVAKDHDKFDQNTFNPILRGYVGKDLDTAAGRNTEAFKIELKKDSSATDHVATLLHSTKEFGNGQRLALTIDDDNSYPDGKNLVLTQNGVKITADDSAFTDSDELLEVEGNAKIDGNLEVTGTLSAGGDGTISGDELFLTDSIKHVGDTDTSISFPSNDTIRFRTAGAARLDINSNGNVGIGNTSPDSKLKLQDSSDVAIHILKTGSQDTLLRNTGQTEICAASGGGGGQRIVFKIGASTGSMSDVAKFTDSGLCFGTDTAGANALDDYEEGTWTPTINSSLNANIAVGRYVKVGSLVMASGRLDWNSNSGSGGGIGMGGLPFATHGDSNTRTAATVGYMIGFDTSGNRQLVMGATNNTTNMYVQLLNDNGAGFAIGAQNCSSSGEIQFTITYRTDA
jgi:hypothetical protein